MLSQTLLLALAAQVAPALLPPPPIPDPALPGRGNAALDVQHYRLELRLEPDRRYVTGRATLEIGLRQPLQRLALDFHHLLEVTGTRVDGKQVPWTQGDHKLVLDLPPDHPSDHLQATVEYRGLLPQTPSQGDAVGLVHDGHTLVAYLEPDGAHHFFPCNDHPSDKATYDLVIEVPEGNLVGALGALVAEGPGPTPGYRQFHWRTDIPTATYLVALGAGPYVRIERDSPVPIIDFVEARDRKDMTQSLAPVVDMLPWCVDRFGPYPFEKYGHVITRNWVGGMEDQSLTVLGREEARSGDPALLIHELAHQWFGDWVSPRQWSDLWLNEGWATYAEWLWFRDHDLSAAARSRQLWRNSTMRLAIRAHPHTLAAPDPEALFDGDLVYNKGGMVLLLLDEWLGHDAFLAAAQAYLHEFGGSCASTDDFERIMGRASGVDLKPFFDAWVRRNTVPEIDLQWSQRKVEDQWQIDLQFAQRNGHHPMVLALRLQGIDGLHQRAEVRFEKAQSSLQVRTPFAVSEVILDPDRHVPWYPSTSPEKE